MNAPRFGLTPIGSVESPLTDPAAAPRQGDEGAPDAWLTFDPVVVAALDGLEAGDDIVALTWLHRARRDVLRVHPRGDTRRSEQGVFSARSPDRPNPIGLHRVTILAVDAYRLHVRNLEAVDGTPILDVKPVLGGDVSERKECARRVPAPGRATRVVPTKAPGLAAPRCSCTNPPPEVGAGSTTRLAPAQRTEEGSQRPRWARSCRVTSRRGTSRDDRPPQWGSPSLVHRFAGSAPVHAAAALRPRSHPLTLNQEEDG